MAKWRACECRIFGFYLAGNFIQLANCIIGSFQRQTLENFAPHALNVKFLCAQREMNPFFECSDTFEI
jgi:hypothetical protein